VHIHINELTAERWGETPSSPDIFERTRRSGLERTLAPLWSIVRLALLVLLAVLIAGCGKPAGPPPGGAASPAANRATNSIATNTTNAPANEAMLQKAIFEDRPDGRDPFFPRSSRRKQAAAQVSGEAPKPKLPLSSYLKLTGLVLIKSQPSAWINGSMFAPGERGTAKVTFTNSHNMVEVQEVHLRCLEIRKGSVVIRVEGESGDTVLRVP
jgi:hypothetical protein